MIESFRYPSSDKHHKIYAEIISPDVNEVKGIVQVVHGMKEYFGRYHDFAKFLNLHGYVVCGEDHLGHGHSANGSEELGVFNREISVEYLVEDVHNLSQIVLQKYPGVPLFLLGHSMGSFISRIYISKYAKLLKGYIMMGTANKSIAGIGATIAKAIIKLGTENWKKPSTLLEMISNAGYNSKIEDSSSKNAWLTRDDAIVKAYDMDPYCNYRFKVGGYRDLYSMLDIVSKKEWANSVDKNLPIYIVAGENDPVGGYGKEVVVVYKRLKNAGVMDVETKLYSHQRHEILNELGKEEVYDDILSWIDARL